MLSYDVIKFKLIHRHSFKSVCVTGFGGVKEREEGKNDEGRHSALLVKKHTAKT